MPESLAQLSKGALSDLASVFAAMPEDALDGLIDAIVAAKRIVVFGLGREGLQMCGFAMRLFHMGRDVAVWGDMTTPALGAGDLFIASAGPAISRPRKRWLKSRAKAARARRSSPPNRQADLANKSTSSRSFPPRRWPMIKATNSPSCRWAPCSRPRK
jgi:DNA-binding MurR/RpiR family transcriptional regulator